MLMAGDPLVVGPTVAATDAADVTAADATTAAGEVAPCAAACGKPTFIRGTAGGTASLFLPPAASSGRASRIPILAVKAAAGRPVAAAPAGAGAVFPMHVTATAGQVAAARGAVPPAGGLSGVISSVADAVADDHGRIVLVGVFSVRALAVDEVVRGGIVGIPPAACIVFGQCAVGEQIRTRIHRRRGHPGLADELHFHRGIARDGINVRRVDGNLVIADGTLNAVLVRIDMGIDGIVVNGRNASGGTRIVVVGAATERKVGHHFHQDVMILCTVQIKEPDFEVKLRRRGRIRNVPQRKLFFAACLGGNDFRLVGHGIHADDLILAHVLFLADQFAG